jgi:UDP-2,3-diacylglucosamine pyrophosphatase LpxH
VVGNHDTALEHVLNTWLGDYLTPFLDVASGGRRVHIEHGHIYDSFYVASPHAYELAGAAAAPLLRVYPDAYRLASAASRLRGSAQRLSRNRGPEHDPAEIEAAAMIAQRGFDVVVFGHTHRAERAELPRGAVYLNCGDWLRNSTFVEISDGDPRLLRWQVDHPVPVTSNARSPR